jgi:hypothetical protein
MVGDQARGAMSVAFMATIKEAKDAGKPLSYHDLLLGVREKLTEDNRTQKPQLSASHPIGESPVGFKRAGSSSPVERERERERSNSYYADVNLRFIY